MYCLGCKYDLRKLTITACPECGRPFDPSNPRTYRRAFHHRWRAYLIAAAALPATFVVSFVIMFFVSMFDDSNIEHLGPPSQMTVGVRLIWSAINAWMWMILSIPVILLGLATFMVRRMIASRRLKSNSGLRETG